MRNRNFKRGSGVKQNVSKRRDRNKSYLLGVVDYKCEKWLASSVHIVVRNEMQKN